MSEQQRDTRGIKDISHKVIECPEFIPTPSTKSHWKNATGFHDSFLRRLASEVESSGFKCSAEFGVEHDFPQGMKVRGKADLVCENQDTVLLFEVKSFPLGRASLGDRNQLLFYAYIMMKQSLFPGKEIVPILAYTNDDADPGMLPVKSGVVNLPPGQYVVLNVMDGLTETVESNVRAYHILTSSKRKTFVMGKHCFKCDNQNCIIIRSRMMRRG
ncbi:MULTISPECIES: hypothetical protein [Metallosphaera]|uniref:hypothetical protein n=1 Tax=Metallosphaera TaxID=41980 RepID=UPI001F05742F|nr:hypothetical protein [Metallosphaera sedula]MCH1771523.1 hypothetical protein [Metallosphaera sedula]